MKPKNRATTPAHAVRDDDDTLTTPLPDQAPTTPTAPTAAELDAADIGTSYTLELQRHARQPLYRLRERSVAADGSTVERGTPWVPFSAWTPELLLARKRLQDFVFSGDPRMPRSVEVPRRS